MFGFVIGALCLYGLIRVIRGGRRGACGGGWSRRGGYRDRWDERGDRDRDHGWGHRGRWGGDGREWFLGAILERLDATPAQEKVIRVAVDEVREAGKAARTELKESRREVARTFRGSSIDEVFFGELFARHDNAIEAVRKAGVGAIHKIHDVLDDKQRERLADLIEEGPRGFFGRAWR